ncbi:hypothetical protein I7I50_11790 [Histoplasma capsulatum G186AR]|uniref:Uncharacterized protein n=1 Tax=Ajellomyces capsulatus TaxID=5037 RepID=A0A8H7ZA81_AJECA|nr:hypothetical protein I7I52_03028 [Histoplasma capsulatum]QSS70230.1 hypothetical protein I7I50_11790 [Histoplasma capsulatum G186AR]
MSAGTRHHSTAEKEKSCAVHDIYIYVYLKSVLRNLYNRFRPWYYYSPSSKGRRKKGSGRLS